MEKVDVIAVLGACTAERQAYADNLQRDLLKHSSPVKVLDIPALTPTQDVIGELADPEAETLLKAVACIVDAAHCLQDLAAEDFVTTKFNNKGETVECAPRALLTATHMEYASHIVLVNWESMPTHELSTLMGLISYMAPFASLTLAPKGLVGADSLTTEAAPFAGSTYSRERQQPGWVAAMNNDFRPHITDNRISSFRYEELRPFHPERLKNFLDHRLGTGEFGLIMRSAGFCRFATRARSVLQWDHVGQTIAFHHMTEETGLAPESEVLVLGQDLVFFGLDIRHFALQRALNETLLTDAELQTNPDTWVRFKDPFPVWQPTHELP